MDINQAIELIDKATSLLTINRQEHVAIQQAITVIKEATQPKEKPKKK